MMTKDTEPTSQEYRPSVVCRGRSVRLETAVGTFSYYHPSEIFTDCAWDAQTASSLLASARTSPRSVLILGLGGGTIARQIHTLFGAVKIVGVERNEDIINLANEHFPLHDWGVKVIRNCSIKFLRTNHDRFDVILDDVWPPNGDEARPIFAVSGYDRLVRRSLTPKGVYAATAYRGSTGYGEVTKTANRIRRSFRDLVEVRPADGPTTVVAAGTDLVSGRTAHRRRRLLPPVAREGLSHIRFFRIKDALKA